MKKVIILNLTDNISLELKNYFEARGVKLIDPREDETSYQWTHILTKDINDFRFIRETYQTIENDIQIISISTVTDRQNFVLANGKLCLDEQWFKTDLKDFLLDKFFQNYLASNLSQDVLFNELGQFSIHQFFSFGDHLDRLTKAAFSVDIPGLAVKTYIDHLVMYLAALKNNAKMELPIEVAYGDSDQAFGIQLFFSAQNLMMDDVSACLSLNNSRHAEETLLSTALSFCDFFDFSLISNAQKVSITALWLKECEIEHPSFMLSYLPHRAQLVSYINDDSIQQDLEFNDPEGKIVLPASKSSDGVREIAKESFSDVIATRISEAVELEKVQKIVGQDLTDEEIYNLLESSAQEEQKIILGSEEAFEDVVSKISSSFEGLEAFNKDFFKEEEVLNYVIDSLRDNHQDIMQIKSLASHLPENLKNALSHFCQEKMIVQDQLTREHINEFQVHFLKNNLRKDTVVLNSQGRELIKDLKTRLESGLKNEFQEDDVVSVLNRAAENDPDKLRVKSIFKNTLKESLEVKFEFSRNGTISEEQEKIIVSSLASSLGEEAQVIREIVTNEEGVKPHKPLFVAQVSEKEKALLVQLESLQQEKKGLADKLQSTLMEIKVLKESKTAVSSIQSRAADVSHKETQQEHFDENIVLKKEIQEKLVAGNINANDQKRLNELMEKELQLMTTVREEMMKFKKLQIESTQKEALFTSEIEKLNRQLKARDLILNKSKESMLKFSERKDDEIHFLKNKLDQVQLNFQKENSNNYGLQVKHLEVQNLNLAKQMDVYKAKLSSLSEKLKKKDRADSSKEDFRKIELEKNQLQNQLMKQTKDLQRANYLLEKEVSASKELKEAFMELKQEMMELEKAPIKSEVTAKKEEALNNSGLNETVLIQQAKINTLEAQVRELEQRLAESLKVQRSGAVDEKKMLHVEASLKKVTQDLLEARNQTNDYKKENNKLRQEKTAIQNQLDRMKKESLKAKKSA